jgi:hypothetical protein
MFVLGDRENFFFRQAAEGNAILKTDHDRLSLHETRSFTGYCLRPGGGLIWLKPAARPAVETIAVFPKFEG